MNTVILIGRLTKNPEMRYTPSGTSVLTFTIAVDRAGKKDEADFINIVVWSKLADLCDKYLSKGKQVAIQGRMQTRNYEANDGRKVYITEVVANEVKFLSPSSKQEGLMDGAQTVPAEDTPFDY